MIAFGNIRTLFFDYDGCLHNSIKIYGPAFRKAYADLVVKGLAEERDWKDDEISYWLGFSSEDMWKAFMPHLDESTRSRSSSIIGEEMKRLIEEGRPELYKGVPEVLSYLKGKGYHLVFISNCRAYYRDSHCRRLHLDEYFEELACSEDYRFLPKDQILRRIKTRYPMDMVIIGDRMQDIEAGRKNGIYTIGCRYGFARKGEIEHADLLIHDIMELMQYF